MWHGPVLSRSVISLRSWEVNVIRCQSWLILWWPETGHTRVLIVTLTAASELPVSSFIHDFCFLHVESNNKSADSSLKQQMTVTFQMENVSVSAGGWLATLEERSDPRVSSWPLMSSPLPTLLLCLAYLAVVKVVGPLYMEGRKPYDLKLPMLAYNLFQVMFNGWIFLGPAVTFSRVWPCLCFRRRELLVWRWIQLAVSACGLLQQPRRHEGPLSRLVVLLVKVHRLFRLFILPASRQGKP